MAAKIGLKIKTGLRKEKHPILMNASFSQFMCVCVFQQNTHTGVCFS